MSVIIIIIIIIIMKSYINIDSNLYACL